MGLEVIFHSLFKEDLLKTKKNWGEFFYILAIEEIDKITMKIKIYINLFP